MKRNRGNEFRKKIRSNPHVVLSVPAVLCFISFITNFIASMKDGNIDSAELHQLLSSADGFETVLLVIVMFVLHKKK